jgi:hypothetical protein
MENNTGLFELVSDGYEAGGITASSDVLSER